MKSSSGDPKACKKEVFMMNPNSQISEVVDEVSVSSTETLGSYELLKREGEWHLGRAQVIEELRGNMARLEDLHGKLQYLLGEVETILRR